MPFQFYSRGIPVGSADAHFGSMMDWTESAIVRRREAFCKLADGGLRFLGYFRQLGYYRIAYQAWDVSVRTAYGVRPEGRASLGKPAARYESLSSCVPRIVGVPSPM